MTNKGMFSAVSQMLMQITVIVMCPGLKVVGPGRRLLDLLVYTGSLVYSQSA